MTPGSPAPDPAGQTITFTLGGQSCNGTTDSNGVASCALASVSGSALGPKTLTASFTGDSYYTGSSASGNVIVFAFPGSGAFALGNNTVAAATSSTKVTWWDSNWNPLNNLSGGSARRLQGLREGGPAAGDPPAAFCSRSWASSGGNSPPPPATVPSYMGVVVAPNITKAGATINGS